MRYDEPLVAGVAIALALIAAAVAIGPWNVPYRLRTIDAVSHRYGKPVARVVWVVVAVTMFATGLAIISGVRPTYAVPSQDVSADR
jgi:hypothetical protein